jgi:hypothetical protein
MQLWTKHQKSMRRFAFSNHAKIDRYRFTKGSVVLLVDRTLF